MPARFSAEPLAVPALAFIAGIGTGFAVDLPWLWMAVFLLFALWFLFRNSTFTLLLLLFCAGAALSSFRHHHAQAVPFLADIEPGEGRFVQAEGTLIALPEEDPVTGNLRLRLHVTSMTTEARASPVPADQKVQVVSPAPGFTLEYGDHLRIEGLLRRPRGPRNPGEFDARSFLHQQGIHGEIASAWGDNVILLERGGGNPLIAVSLKARQWISRNLLHDLENEPVARVINAVVLGEREGVPWEITEDFRFSGTMHVFAVSGLHVGLVGWLIFEILKMLGLPRRYAVLGVIITVLFYAFVTGLRPSAVRAAVMMTIFLGGIVANRPARILNSLGAAAFVLLLFDPLQLLRPGFQLSFLVLLSIALLAPALRQWFSARFQHDPFLPASLLTPTQRLAGSSGGAFADYLAITTSAWIGSAPLILIYFHLVAPVALIANFVVVPLAFLILSTALAILLLNAAQLAGVAVFLNNACLGLASTLAATVAFFSGIPGGHLHVPWERFLDSRDATIVVLDTHSGSAPCVVHRKTSTHLVQTAPHRTDERILQNYLRNHGLIEVEMERLPSSWEPLLEHTPARAGVLEQSGWRILFLGDLSFAEEKDLLASDPEILRCDVLIKAVAARDLSGLPASISAADPDILVLAQSRYRGGSENQAALLRRLRSEGRHVIDQATAGAVTIGIQEHSLEITATLDQSIRHSLRRD
ncbi:MAG: ComEC/Rec2 family competence protein [Verrucomicrobiota bacterium]